MKIRIRTKLACPLDKAWDAVTKTETLDAVAYPLINFTYLGFDGRPERWKEGDILQVRVVLFKIFDLGVRTIEIRKVDGVGREILMHEKDRFTKWWKHKISLTSERGGLSSYEDFIDFDAGLMTFPTWLLSLFLYKYRHWRWRRMSRALIK